MAGHGVSYASAAISRASSSSSGVAKQTTSADWQVAAAAERTVANQTSDRQAFVRRRLNPDEVAAPAGRPPHRLPPATFAKAGHRRARFARLATHRRPSRRRSGPAVRLAGAADL
jgi:hypothetical protein